MNKAEFTSRLAKRADLTGVAAGRVVQAFLDEVGDALASGEEVAFSGFGKFSVSRRAARTGVNPRDPSKKIKIAEARVPRFSAGTVLKRQVSDGGTKRRGAAKRKSAKK